MATVLSIVVLCCQVQFLISSFSLARTSRDLKPFDSNQHLSMMATQWDETAPEEVLKGFRRRSKREVCTCNEKGTLYDLCHPLPAHNFKCICKGGHSGDFCDECGKFFFGYPNCEPCSCSHFGSQSQDCHTDTGQCDCKQKVGGRMCDRCFSGYFRFPICQACSCPKNKTISEVCNRFTGACLCKENFEGDDCEQCSVGYFGYPECHACSCNMNGSSSNACNATTGQCICKENFSGLKCGACLNEDMTGENCDIPKDKKDTSFVEGNEGNTTIAPDVKENGGKGDGDKGYDKKNSDAYCDHVSSCNDGSSKKFSTCTDLFYNDTESRVSTCVSCGCFGEGTVASVLNCDKATGKCPCKSHVRGRTCDTCKDGYYGTGHGSFLGCKACQCEAGSSIGSKCDSSGRCTCRSNIEGDRCNRVRAGRYFLPSPYQLKYEFEDGFLEDGSPVAYEYSSFVFPEFSWKGYVPFGYGQENVTLRVNVAKTGRYTLALKYLVSSTTGNFATLLVRNSDQRESRQYKSNLKFEFDKDYRGRYATSSELSDIELTPGEWEIHVASTSVALYLDHLVLVRKEFYNPRELLIPIPEPCNIEDSMDDFCSMYQHPSLAQEGFHSFPGNSAFVRRRSWNSEALDFEDPDMLRLLGIDGLAMISSNQVAIHFNMSVNTTGRYKLVVEYFNADQRAYKIDFVGQETKGDHFMAASCSFKFLCRSVVLTERNVPSSFHFSADEVNTVFFTGAVEGMIGINRVVAIPEEFYTNEYIEPRFSCLSREEKCFDYVKLPALQGTIPMIQSDIEHVFTAVLPSSAWRVLVLHYKQPQYTKFAIEVTFKMKNDVTLKYIDLEYCPSTTGCRIKHSFYSSEGDIKIIIRKPKRRDFLIESISLQLDTSSRRWSVEPTHLDIHSEYQRSCLDGNSLPLTKGMQELCKKWLFGLSAGTNGGAAPCRCRSRGSIGLKCDKDGGQCECRRNIIGRQCQSCRAGFYNYPFCRKCQCFMIGSQSPDCNANGQCICKSRFAGAKCGRCKSALFYNFPECKPCNCNTFGSLGLFCHSRTGQCQCLRNFRGRKCDQCQIGFHQFPDCIQCSCFAAGIAVDGGHTCYPGPKGQCSCKQNVMGALCNQCKDLFYGLQMSKPLGCSPCKCHKMGTLNGVGICDKDTGKCPCKPNVDQRSQTCDTCKDGYYGLSRNNVLGCTACNCNPGGSVSNVCEKKYGQCRCRPNVTGKKCDRLIDDTFYVPSIRHLKFKAKHAKATDGRRLLPETDSEFVAIAQHKAPVVWKINVESSSDFVFIVTYRTKMKREVALDIAISHASYGYMVFKTTATLKQTISQNDINPNTGLFILRENKKDLLLSLYPSSYNIKLFTNATDFFVDFIALIPNDYLNGGKLVSVPRLPCTVFGSLEPCIKYSYLSIPRKDFYTIEVESTGRQAAEMLDTSLYPSLNINGAILLRSNKPFTLQFVQPSTDSFYMLIQYFKPNPQDAKLVIHINGPNETNVAKIPLAYCPYEFACRDVLLATNRALQVFKLTKDSMYTVSLSTADNDVIALDRIVLIPQRLWSFEFISPAPFCVAVDHRCIKTNLIYPKGHIKLHSARSRQYVKPRNLPPNMLNPLLRPMYLQSGGGDVTTLIRWNIPLERGYFYVIVHYFQPLHPSATVKIIMNTFYASIAGKIVLKFCPHAEGCRAAITAEDVFSDRFAGLYLSGSVISATISLPKGFTVWIDYVMFIHPTRDYSQERLLYDREIRQSETYRQDCIRNYDIVKSLKKSCFNWLFHLSMAHNDGPRKCDCSIHGSKTASCDLIGGQCRCKNHVTGRTCSQCAKGYWIYPLCKRALKK